MVIRILAAPPASGKTHFCVEHIRQALRERPGSDIWVLVADGSQALQFRRRLAAAGGALGVQVVTFNNLLRDIVEQGDQALPLAPPALLQAFVQQAVDEVSARGELQHYAGIRARPGFCAALRDVFAALKRSLVYPEDFSAVVAGRQPALGEIAALYSAYQAALRSTGWADPEGLSWLAIEFLRTNPGWKPDWSLLVLDGFDSFTRSQLRALELLRGRVSEILITLPGSPHMTRQVHLRFEETLQHLRQLDPDVPVETLQDTYLPASIRHLEAGLFVPGVPRFSGGKTVQFIETRTQAEEAREVLRWMKRQVMQRGVSLGECAIFVPNLALYRPHLRAAAGEFGLPLAFAGGEPLTRAPFFRALRGLLALPMQDFPRRPLLEALRAPYWDLSVCSLAAEQVGQLDVVSRALQITGGRAAWLDCLAAFAGNPEAGHDLEDETEDAPTAPRLPTSEEAGRLWQALQRLFDLLAPQEGRHSMARWVAWLEDLLAQLALWQVNTPPLEEDPRPLLRQLLRELVLAAQVVRRPDVDFSGFLQALEQAAQTAVLGQPAVHVPQGIEVRRVGEGRGVRCAIAAVMGLSEGLFPGRQHPDPFIDESTRASAGLETALDPHQAGLFYQAVTRADERLLLARPTLAPDGEPWQPSPFWEAAARLFVESACRIVPEMQRPLTEAASPAELLAWVVQWGTIPRELQEALGERTAKVTLGRQVLLSRQERDSSSPFHGRLESILPLSNEWSATRFEAYLGCPYQYFSQYLLVLQPAVEPEMGMDVMQRGKLLHRILERVYRETPDPTCLDEVLRSFETVAREEFTQAPQTLAFRPGPLWDHEQAELANRLEETIRGLHENSAGWQPYLLEARFGGSDAPSLVLRLDDISLSVRGIIDRVDRKPDGSLRIIDYKTGSSGFGKSALLNGERLQLPLYALAARDALRLGEPVDGFYWSINQAEASSLRITLSSLEEYCRLALEHIRRVVSGVRRGDFSPATTAEGCADYCPATAWCWQYKPRRQRR